MGKGLLLLPWPSSTVWGQHVHKHLQDRAGRNLLWSTVEGKQLGCLQSPRLRLLSEGQRKGLCSPEPCLGVHREPASSSLSKEQHDRLLVLYPSTLVIVSEERNSLCFKVN